MEDCSEEGGGCGERDEGGEREKVKEEVEDLGEKRA